MALTSSTLKADESRQAKWSELVDKHLPEIVKATRIGDACTRLALQMLAIDAYYAGCHDGIDRFQEKLLSKDAYDPDGPTDPNEGLNEEVPA